MISESIVCSAGCADINTIYEYVMNNRKNVGTTTVNSAIITTSTSNDIVKKLIQSALIKTINPQPIFQKDHIKKLHWRITQNNPYRNVNYYNEKNMEQLRKSDLLEAQIYCAYAIDSCGGSASLDQIEYQIADKLPPLFSQDGNPWKGDKKGSYTTSFARV